MKEGFIYAIEAVGANAVKIGFSNDVARRRTSLQDASPFDLVLLDSVRGTRDYEWAIHQHLRERMIRGEWFRLDDGFRAVVPAIIRSGEVYYQNWRFKSLHSDAVPDTKSGDRICLICLKPFLATRRWSKHCSVECKNAFHVNRRREAIKVHRGGPA